MGVDGQLQVGKRCVMDEWTAEGWIFQIYSLNLYVGLTVPSKWDLLHREKKAGYQTEDRAVLISRVPLPPMPGWADLLTPACSGFSSHGTQHPWPHIAWPGMDAFPKAANLSPSVNSKRGQWLIQVFSYHFNNFLFLAQDSDYLSVKSSPDIWFPPFQAPYPWRQASILTYSQPKPLRSLAPGLPPHGYNPPCSSSCDYCPRVSICPTNTFCLSPSMPKKQRGRFSFFIWKRSPPESWEQGKVVGCGWKGIFF